MRQYGVGPITATTMLCELGDVTRLSASRKAVRASGLDVGVYRSDRHSRTGRITRQGAPALRWALDEAAQCACKPASPDHADYLALKARGLSHTRASLTIARKLARRSYHLLRALGPAALDPPDTTPANRSAQAHSSTMRPPRAASSRSDRGTHAQRGGPRKTERPQSLHRNDRSTIKSPAANARGRVSAHRLRAPASIPTFLFC
jgi:hypothetical protein